MLRCQTGKVKITNMCFNRRIVITNTSLWSLLPAGVTGRSKATTMKMTSIIPLLLPAATPDCDAAPRLSLDTPASYTSIFCPFLLSFSLQVLQFSFCFPLQFSLSLSHLEFSLPFHVITATFFTATLIRTASLTTTDWGAGFHFQLWWRALRSLPSYSLSVNLRHNPSFDAIAFPSSYSCQWVFQISHH